MDYILIGDRAAIADSIKEKSQELLDVYAVGLLITTVNRNQHLLFYIIHEN
jgi:hypothetical protein